MIKVATPKVYFIAATQVYLDSMHEYVASLPESTWEPQPISGTDILPEFAGRICYQAFAKPRPGGNIAYIENIKQQRHGSVLEHSNFTFLFTGVSRSFTHELVRHRAGFAYSQLSQRYVDESNTAFVCPPGIIAGSLEYSEWEKACAAALVSYQQLVGSLGAFGQTNDTDGRKRVRQTARAVLPNCTETHILVTANARAWRHFLEMRGSAAADTEMRNVAVLVAQFLYNYSPNVFSDYTPVRMSDGIVCLQAVHTKV